MNTRMSLLATILMLSSSLFAKDYLISTSGTSLLLSAEPGEKSKIQYYGVAITPEQIQHIYDAGLALNSESYPAFGLRSLGQKAIAMTQPDGNMSLDLGVETVTQPADENKPCSLHNRIISGRLLMEEGITLNSLLKGEYSSLALELQEIEKP